MSSKNIETLANRRFLCNKPKQSDTDLIINTPNNTNNKNYNTHNKTYNNTYNNTYNFLSLYIIVYFYMVFSINIVV